MFDKFIDYVATYDFNDDNIYLKYDHSIRVGALCMAIAKSLNLAKEDIDLACFIGFIHDIGRFKQWETYQDFVDSRTIDHGELGVRILFEEAVIKHFITDPSNDEIIRLAVYHHNKLALPTTLDAKTLTMAKILRDADKIDILRIKANETILLGPKRKASDKVLASFMNEEAIKLDDLTSLYDSVILWLSFIYNLEYPISVEILRKTDYVSKMLAKLEEAEVDRFDMIKAKTDTYLGVKEKDKDVRQKVQSYSSRKR